MEFKSDLIIAQTKKIIIAQTRISSHALLWFIMNEEVWKLLNLNTTHSIIHMSLKKAKVWNGNPFLALTFSFQLNRTPFL